MPAQQPRSVRRLGCAARLAVTLLAFVLGLASVEVAMRVRGVHAPIPFAREGGTLVNNGDPVSIFENKPGALERITYFDDPDAPRVVEMRVNAQGFRGPEVALEKPSGTLRVACIGDSHTFGFGVQDGETWPAELERVLRAKASGRAIEVMNCGVDAYDTLQEVLWLENEVLAFVPDVVLLQYYVNDTAIREDTAPPPATDWLFELAQPRRTGFVRDLRAHSRFADFVLDGIYRRRGLAFYSALRMSGYRDDSPGWLRVVDALRRARDGLAARNVRFAVLLYPFLVREGEHLTSHAAFAKVRELCEREQIACFDAESAFDGRDVDALRISPHDYHGNPEANAIFARAVAEWALARGVLAP